MRSALDVGWLAMDARMEQEKGIFATDFSMEVG